MEEVDSGFVISGDGFKISFNKESGWIEQYSVHQEDMLVEAIMPCFWRALTDNDLGNHMLEECGVWRDMPNQMQLKDF